MPAEAIEGKILRLLAGSAMFSLDYVALYILLNTAPGGHFTGAVEDQELGSALINLYKQTLITTIPEPSPALPAPPWPPETVFQMSSHYPR